jgi:hypothetical protein
VPGVIQLPRRDGEVLLTFKADGYRAATRAVRPTAEAAAGIAIQVELEPRSQPHGAPRKRGRPAREDEDVRDELESPF